MKSKHAGILLLVAAYAAAVLLVVQRKAGERKDDRVTIRLAQWQLEGTVRQAIDATIARYEQLNPRVKVEQIAVPDSVYLPWVQTQMVGETGPDMVEYVWIWPNIPRYFQTIDDEVTKPNPYNRGTPLEGVPWRDTNVDGMTNPDSFVRALNHYYGITITSHIPRLVYNVALLKTITGQDRPPATYREFRDLCAQVEAWARTHHRNLVPVATSQDSYPSLMFSIMANATTRLAEQLDYQHRLKVTDIEAGWDYLRGEWSVDSPAFVAGLKQLREFGEVSTPGFQQRNRDSALTDFVNGRALMAVVPSWDASSLLVMCPFKLGAFRYPYPREDDPAYGAFTQGPFSEGQVLTGMGFYVNRRTKHRAEVIDFLHFLTSQEGSQMFTDISNWQPATIGVKPSAFASEFTQVTKGNVWEVSFLTLTGTDADMFMRSQLNKLWSVNGSVDAYRDATRPGLAERMRDDLQRDKRSRLENVCREDAMAAAALMCAPQRPGTLALVTVPNEEKLYQVRDVLARSAHP
ncbi:MAG: ABC transporter substrate-binding protein [Opitutales bacterium]